MRIVSFDGLTLGQAGAEDEIPLEFVSALQTLPGQAGAYDHFGYEQVRRPLTIRRSYKLVASGGNDIGDLLDQLRAKANLGRRWLVVEMTGGEQRGTWAKLINVKVKHTIENLVYVPVTLTFQVPWPWFEDEDQIWRLDTGRLLDDGLTFDGNYTSRSGPGNVTIVNNGGDVITRGMIVITGAVTNPSLLNRANNYTFTYFGTVAAGSTLFIDIGAQSVYEAGVAAWTNLTIPNDQIGLFRIEPGSNLITFSGGGGALEIHWVEVY